MVTNFKQDLLKYMAMMGLCIVRSTPMSEPLITQQNSMWIDTVEKINPENYSTSISICPISRIIIIHYERLQHSMLFRV